MFLDRIEEKIGGKKPGSSKVAPPDPLARSLLARAATCVPCVLRAAAAILLPTQMAHP
jgi:hypothetical protein